MFLGIEQSVKEAADSVSSKAKVAKEKTSEETKDTVEKAKQKLK